MNWSLVPWWAVGVAALLLLALLELPLGAIVQRLADGVRRLFGPARLGEAGGFADGCTHVAEWLAARVRTMVDQHRLTVARFVGGILLTALFVFAVAMETALMQVALELIVPMRDDSMSLLGLRLAPALAAALAVIVFEAGAMLMLLEVLGLTDLFAWDQDWRPVTRRWVAGLFAVAVVALMVVQGALAWVRLSQPDAMPGLPAWATVGAADSSQATSGIGRWIGVVLSALIPIFAAAGALGLHILMLSLAAVAIAIASGLFWLLRHAAAALTTVAQWLSDLWASLLKLLALPGRFVIGTLDGVIAWGARARGGRAS